MAAEAARALLSARLERGFFLPTLWRCCYVNAGAPRLLGRAPGARAARGLVA